MVYGCGREQRRVESIAQKLQLIARYETWYVFFSFRMHNCATWTGRLLCTDLQKQRIKNLAGSATLSVGAVVLTEYVVFVPSREFI